MNEFKHFLRKMKPEWKELLFVIIFIVVGYVEYVYLNTIIIWVIIGLFVLIDIAMDIHFWNEDRKMFQRWTRKGEIMFEEHDRRMKKLWKTLESKDVKN